MIVYKEMPLLTCIICYTNKETLLYKKLNEKCHPELPTILDMLHFCVPKFTDTNLISSNDDICENCLATLKTCVEFIEQCLSIFDNTKEEVLKLEIEDSELNIIETVLVDIKNELPADTGQLKKEETSDDQIISEEEEDKDNIETEIQDDSSDEKFPSGEILKQYITEKNKNEESIGLYKCHVCFAEFKTPYIFKDHLYTEHKVILSCLKCGKNFRSQSRLIAHEELYKNQSTCKLQCEKCGKKFGWKTEFLKHLEKVKDAPSCNFSICRVCSQKFSKEDYQEHMLIHPKYVCEICGKSFPTTSHFYQHKMKHNEPNTAICPKCGKGFIHSQRLNNHIRIVHETTAKKYKCPTCPQKFFHKTKMEVHIKGHENIKDIPCPDCGRMFLSDALMKSHRNAIHLKLRPHVCTQCNKRFTRKNYLHQHIVHIHENPKPNKSPILKFIIGNSSENSELPVKCHNCGKILKNLIQLKQHIKTVHIRVRRFKCEFCEMRFILKNTLMKHQEKHKEPYYEFRCKICYKRHTSQEELTEHLKKHTKLPFRCSICDEGFGRNYLWENHMLNEHPTANISVPQQIIDEVLENAILGAESTTILKNS